MKQVVIVGAGIGGLSAAVRLAQRGCRVTVVDARDRPGGLAASVEYEGIPFDAGPYILLDKLGLEWAFRNIGIEIEPLALKRIAEVYEIDVEDRSLRVFASLEETAAQIECGWPGHGDRYRRFIEQMQARYSRLQPLQAIGKPSLFDLLRSGAWRDIPFLLRSLQSTMATTGLPPAVSAALGIWTHVAGQSMTKAPAPLALVPAVIHSVGAFYPARGIGAIPDTLFAAAKQLGVTFHFSTKVRQICCRDRRACGVEIHDDEFLASDAVISNVGLGTYRQLLDDHGRGCIPGSSRRMLDQLPLQSPGVCAYLAIKGRVEPPYLRFRVFDGQDGCRLLVQPSVLDRSLERNGWSPVRLIAPMNHQRAISGGETQQRAFLAQVLEETWWRSGFSEVRVLATRIPQEWGSSYHLFQESMNPVMTSEFMRAGRLAHRSPWIRQLYLTGSATHPGQWVSFCAMSGVLTANRVLDDFKV